MVLLPGADKEGPIRGPSSLGLPKTRLKHTPFIGRSLTRLQARASALRAITYAFGDNLTETRMSRDSATRVAVGIPPRKHSRWAAATGYYRQVRASTRVHRRQYRRRIRKEGDAHQRCNVTQLRAQHQERGRGEGHDLSNKPINDNFIHPRPQRHQLGAGGNIKAICDNMKHAIHVDGIIRYRVGMSRRKPPQLSHCN